MVLSMEERVFLV